MIAAHDTCGMRRAHMPHCHQSSCEIPEPPHPIAHEIVVRTTPKPRVNQRIIHSSLPCQRRWGWQLIFWLDTTNKHDTRCNSLHSLELTWKWTMISWETMFLYKQGGVHFHASSRECKFSLMSKKCPITPCCTAPSPDPSSLRCAPLSLSPPRPRQDRETRAELRSMTATGDSWRAPTGGGHGLPMLPAEEDPNVRLTGVLQQLQKIAGGGEQTS